MRSLCLFLIPVLALPADWATFGGDAQRSGWARNETILNATNVKNLKLEWKLKLDNAPRAMAALTAPVLVEQTTTPRGFKDLLIVGGASDNLYAIDVDSGKLFWKREFKYEGRPRKEADWLCPNALNATPVIDRRAKSVRVISTDGKLRSLFFVSGEDSMPAVQFVPEFSKNWSLNQNGDMLYTAISQGCNGARSGVYAMDLKDPSHKVLAFYSSARGGGGGIWGRAGAALTFDGKVVAETGDGPFDPAAGKWADTFIGLDGKTLEMSDSYTPANRAWITKKDLDMGCASPIVFKFKNQELVAGGGKEGVLYLLDAKNLGGADHRTPLFRSQLLTNEEVNFFARGFWGAFASYEDDQGTRWLYAPAWGPPASSAPKFPLAYGDTTHGSMMAFKVVEKDGKPTLEPAWISKDMAYPEPPVIAGNVLFALANGSNEDQVDSNGTLLTWNFRVANPAGNAILYAFDAKNGKQLWSSGGDISGWTHFSGIAVAGGRVYVTTWDGMVYAFSTGQQ